MNKRSRRRFRERLKKNRKRAELRTVAFGDTKERERKSGDSDLPPKTDG